MSRDEQKKGLLKRWLQGDANLNDEQQLERLAADDPFLAEAIEGYRSMPEGQHLKNIQELKNRFNKEESNKGLIHPLYLMRIAAGVAILVLSVIAFQWVNNNSSDTLAQKSEAPAEESITENDIDANGIDDLTFNEETQEQEAQYFIDPNTKANKNGDVNGDPLQIKPNLFSKQKKETRPSGSIEGAMTLQEKSTEIALDDADMAADIEPTVAPAPEALGDVAMKDAAVEEISIPSMPLDILPDSTTAYVLNGRVENPAGDPLIGATISVVNSSNNVITDFNGDFKISLQDTQRDQLQIDYVGYKPQMILANKQKNVKVILQEIRALDEAAIEKLKQKDARMSRKKFSSAKKDFINSDPIPIVGFENYKQYIQKELTYPRLARENNIQGTVRLEFFVDGSGTPTNFRVLKTLGFGCDAEAMLLLENGPKWSHPGKVVYEVAFKL